MAGLPLERVRDVARQREVERVGAVEHLRDLVQDPALEPLGHFARSPEHRCYEAFFVRNFNIRKFRLQFRRLQKTKQFIKQVVLNLKQKIFTWHLCVKTIPLELYSFGNLLNFCQNFRQSKFRQKG